MVSLTATSRANLLSLISANSEQDKVGSQLTSGKRVQSVSDNAFSFFQARGLDNRVSTLTQINDRLAINVQAVNQASKAGNKISTALNTVKGLLEDIKSKGASANVETSSVSGSTGATGSIFNRTGTNAAPIDTGTQLADATELGTIAGGSLFTKVGLNANSELTNTIALNATAGALSSATLAGTDSLISVGGFALDDVIKITNGGQSLFVKVKATATSGTLAGNTVGTAIEVATVDQLRTVISGKQINGTTDIDLDAANGIQNLGLTASIDTTGGAGQRFKITSSGSAAVTTAFELQRTTGTGAALAPALGATFFGGQAATQTAATGTGANTVTYSNSSINTATAVGLAANDVIAVKIGTGTGARSIFAQVVTNYTGTPLVTGGPNQQTGDGATAGNAIQVKNLGDLARALSGKRADGITNINNDVQTPTGFNAFSVNVDADSTGSKLKVSSAAATNFSIGTQAQGVFSGNQASSVSLFGGTGGAAVDFAQGYATTAATTGGTTIAANNNPGGLLVNDILSFDVGPETNRTTLFVKVVANYTGANGTQRGNGKGNGNVGTDAPLEVKSIGDLVNALNARDKNNAALSDFSWNNNPSVRATFDASNTTGAAPTAGRFNFTAGTRVAIGLTRYSPVVPGGPATGQLAATAAGAIFGTGGTGATGASNSATITAEGLGTSTQVIGTTINNAAKEQRLSAAKAFRDTLDSIDRITTDAQISGLNLLRNATGFDAVLSETATQNVRLRSTVTNAASLGFTVINNVYQDGAQAEFATNADVDQGLLRVDAAIASLSGRDTELDVQTSLLTERRTFNDDIIKGLGDLSTDLTAVNQEEASAQAAAASFSSNAALKFLGVSGQRASQLLQIF